jgi:hypothetical protein
MTAMSETTQHNFDAINLLLAELGLPDKDLGDDGKEVRKILNNALKLRRSLLTNEVQ